jgi:hypothetical protein
MYKGKMINCKTWNQVDDVLLFLLKFGLKCNEEAYNAISKRSIIVPLNLYIDQNNGEINCCNFYNETLNGKEIWYDIEFKDFINQIRKQKLKRILK